MERRALEGQGEGLVKVKNRGGWGGGGEGGEQGQARKSGTVPLCDWSHPPYSLSRKGQGRLLVRAEAERAGRGNVNSRLRSPGNSGRSAGTYVLCLSASQNTLCTKIN